MARKENEYVTLKLKFEKFVESLSNDFAKNNILNSNLNSIEFSDMVYTFLSDNDYDKESYKFVYESIKIDNPKLTYKKFIEKYTNKDVGNISSIDNKNIGDRLTNRLVKEGKILQGRLDRLSDIKKDTTVDGWKKNSWDVKRILTTSKTEERYLTNLIKEEKKILRRNIRGSEYRTAKSNIEQYTKELTLVKDKNKALFKQFNNLEYNYTNMNENELKKAIGGFISNIENDIKTNQNKVMIKQAFRSSVSHPAKVFAQTEYVNTVTQNDIKQFKDEQTNLNDDEVLLVKWKLSASHNIVDICDEYAENDIGYGKGIYPIDDSPQPIVDTHPNCRCSLIKYGVK